MESLKTIQKVAKLAKIVSKILFVLCTISLIILIMTCIIVAFLPNNITINSQQFSFIEGLEKIDSNVNIAKGIILDSLFYSIIILIGEIYITGKAVKYFEFELEEGTPFSVKSADKMKELGILSIAVPIIASLVALITHIIIKALLNEALELQGDFKVSLTMGLFFLFLSAVFRYGASLKNPKTEDTEKEEETEAEETEKEN